MIEHVVLVIAGLTVATAVCRLIYYDSKLKAITRHLKAFVDIMNATSDRKSNMEAYALAHADLAERWPEMTELFAQARLRVLFGRQVGIGGFQPTGSISVWESLREDGGEQQRLILEALHQAKGYFRTRRNESFSPIFWIESFFMWPRSLLSYLGISSNGAFAKSLQILVLILEIAGGVILVTNNFQ